MSVETSEALRYTTIPLTHGSGAIPAVGFGTLIPDPVATQEATKIALEVGWLFGRWMRKNVGSHWYPLVL
jgi:hypothetical protein